MVGSDAKEGRIAVGKAAKSIRHGESGISNGAAEVALYICTYKQKYCASTYLRTLCEMHVGLRTGGGSERAMEPAFAQHR